MKNGRKGKSIMGSATKTGRDQSQRLTRRHFLLGTGAVAASISLAPRSQAAAPAPTTAPAVKRPPTEMMINSYGGSFEKSLKTAYIEPFEKEFNVKFTLQQGLSFDTLARLRAQKGKPEQDVAIMDWIPITMAIGDDLIDSMDPKNVPNLEKQYPMTRGPENRYAGSHIVSCGIAYNPKFVKTPPTSWLDLWKPEYKGKISLPDFTTTAGYVFLVAIARTQGGSEYKIDPGFAKLRELKPNILAFYKSPDQLLTLMNQGDVWLAVWSSDRAHAAQEAGTPMEWVDPPVEGGFMMIGTIGVPKGAKNKTLAEQFVNYYISTEHQTVFDTLQKMGPTNREVKLPPDVAKVVPYGEAVNKLQTVDAKVLVQQLPAWTDRWGREITG